MRTSLIAVAVALCVACEAPVPQAPPGKLAGVRVVDLIPVSLSGETWQDAEPFLALYVSNPHLLAASAFTPNPGGSTSPTAPTFVSNAGGDSWPLRNTRRSRLGRRGPSIRPGRGRDRPVHVASLGRRSPTGAAVAGAAVAAREDSAASGATPSRDLLAPSDHLPGRLVAIHVTIPWSNAPTLGQERIGSTPSIAVDALHSDNVYVAWADRVGTGDISTLHERRPTDHGAT